MLILPWGITGRVLELIWRPLRKKKAEREKVASKMMEEMRDQSLLGAMVGEKPRDQTPSSDSPTCTSSNKIINQSVHMGGRRHHSLTWAADLGKVYIISFPSFTKRAQARKEEEEEQRRTGFHHHHHHHQSSLQRVEIHSKPQKKSNSEKGRVFGFPNPAHFQLTIHAAKCFDRGLLRTN
jgi:hypothetical protein